jgi:Glycosyl transferases group 1
VENPSWKTPPGTSREEPVELVSVSFKWSPKEEILPQAAAWRLLDLSESNARPVDLVIASKFPTYFVRHPNKVAWLMHQSRAVYELCGTPYRDFSHTELDVGLRDTLIRLDTQMLGECRAVDTNARNMAARVEKFNGLRATPLYHPPRLAARLAARPYGDYILSVGRIESVKRVDLAVRALKQSDRSVRLVVAGNGTEREHVEREARDCGVADRVTFHGAVGADELIGLYAGALAVVYALRRGFRVCHARIVSRAEGRDHLRGLGWSQRIRPRWHQRVRPRAGAGRAAAFSRLAADKAKAAALSDAGHEVEPDHVGRRDRNAPLVNCHNCQNCQNCQNCHNCRHLPEVH